MALSDIRSAQTTSYAALLGRMQQAVEGPPSASASMTPDSFVRTGGGTYTVQPGDTLSGIARRMLGDGNLWRSLFNANRGVISDPNRIYPGQVLALPESAAQPIAQPAPPPESPVPPAAPQPPATSLLSLFHQIVEGYRAAKLNHLTAERIKQLGESDKQAFFAALRPAAEQAEIQYGVPAAVTLAQVALESGWGQHSIAGYNLFGIKGHGPAGTVRLPTHEVINGQYVGVEANFAMYHSYAEAVTEHGKLFHNGYYNRAITEYQRDRDPRAFARNINGIYATAPDYASKLIGIMNDYQLA